VRCRAAGVPETAGFATKGALAQRMLARAFAAGARAAWATWVVGETISGSDELRTWLQTPQPPYVLAVAATPSVWVAGQAQPVGLVAALLPDEAWVPLAAGEGSQGPRLSTWAWLEVDAEPGARGGWRVALVDPAPAELVRAQQACLLSGLGAATDHAGRPRADSGPTVEE
jgi:hypothetical protein